MVKYIVSEQLVGREVITTDGFDIGKLVDLEIDEMTGKLTHILVDPNGDSEFVKKLPQKAGVLQVSYNSVIAVNDFIMVDRKGF